MPTPSAIAEKIHDERIARDMTVRELAERAGVDETHLARFERGEKDMSTPKIERLLDILGITVLGPADAPTESYDDTPRDVDEALIDEPSAA